MYSRTTGLVGGMVPLLMAHTARIEEEDKIIRIISARRAIRKERKLYDENRKETLSDSRPTAGRKHRLKKLSRKPDHEINTSDIPELTEKFWQNAVRNPFYRPLKQQLSLRLDADVIAWLRRQGRGYQTRANALLHS